MPEATQTAVIIPIASAEPAVSKHRLRFDLPASEGVPAHVTVLFPFVPPIDVDDEVIARLARVRRSLPLRLRLRPVRVVRRCCLVAGAGPRPGVPLPD